MSGEKKLKEGPLSGCVELCEKFWANEGGSCNGLRWKLPEHIQTFISGQPPPCYKEKPYPAS